MTPWDIIEIALARQFRPPRDQQWLAGSLHVTPQAVHGWKKTGVPARRFREIAGLLNLTVDQLEGLSPLPWDKGWPFADIEPERFYQLTMAERDIVQRRLMELIEEMERARRIADSPQTGLSGMPGREIKRAEQPKLATVAKRPKKPRKPPR